VPGDINDRLQSEWLSVVVAAFGMPLIILFFARRRFTALEPRPVVMRAAAALPHFVAPRRLAVRPQLEKSHPAHVVAWWELRRLPYNLIVGATAS